MNIYPLEMNINLPIVYNNRGRPISLRFVLMIHYLTWRIN